MQRRSFHNAGFDAAAQKIIGLSAQEHFFLAVRAVFLNATAPPLTSLSLQTKQATCAMTNSMKFNQL